MRARAAIGSLLAAAYVAAALLPCPPVEAPRAAIAHGAEAHEAHAHEPRAHTARAHGAQARARAHEARTHAVAARERGEHPVGPSFSAPCPCGCGERSAASPSAGKLGFALLSAPVVLARAPGEARVSERAPGAPSRPAGELDPVPI